MFNFRSELSRYPSVFSFEELDGRCSIWVGQNNELGDLLAAAPEGDYRALSMEHLQCELKGGLTDRLFATDFEVTVGLSIKQQLVPRFLHYLRDNAFQVFGEVSSWKEEGDITYAQTTLPLSSPTYVQVCHELVAFVIRSGPEVETNSYTEIFDEAANRRRYGGLPMQDRLRADASIRWTIPSLNKRARLTPQGELQWTSPQGLS